MSQSQEKARRTGSRVGGGTLDGHTCLKCGKLWSSSATHPDETYLFITRYCPLCLPTMTSMVLDPAPPRYKHKVMAGHSQLVRKPAVPEGY